MANAHFLIWPNKYYNFFFTKTAIHTHCHTRANSIANMLQHYRPFRCNLHRKIGTIFILNACECVRRILHMDTCIMLDKWHQCMSHRQRQTYWAILNWEGLTANRLRAIQMNVKTKSEFHIFCTMFGSFFQMNFES